MRYTVHKDDGAGVCAGCGESWPCPTVENTVVIAFVDPVEEL